MNVNEAITQAFDLNDRLQDLLHGRNEERIANRYGVRHVLSTVYWSLTVDHHQAILHLFESGYHSSACALLRCFEEAFLRSFVAMYGTDNEVAALWDDKYNAEFEVLGKRMDEKLGLNTRYRYGDFFKIHIKTLHGFTHGGMGQLASFINLDSNNIASLDPTLGDNDIRALVIGTVVVLFLATLFVTDFWGYTSEYQTVQAMYFEYVVEAATAMGIDVNAIGSSKFRVENPQLKTH